MERDRRPAQRTAKGLAAGRGHSRTRLEQPKISSTAVLLTHSFHPCRSSHSKFSLKERGARRMNNN